MLRFSFLSSYQEDKSEKTKYWFESQFFRTGKEIRVRKKWLWKNNLANLKLVYYSTFQLRIYLEVELKLVSQELLHFGVIARLFRQIGGDRSRFVLCSSIWRLFTIRMIKSVKVFAFSFWKLVLKKYAL